MSQKITLSSLGRFWQVLFKGYQELQFGSHLYQLGEIIIIRLIYLYDGPSPDYLIKKIEQKIKKNEDTKLVLQTNIEDNSSKIVNLSNDVDELGCTCSSFISTAFALACFNL